MVGLHLRMIGFVLLLIGCSEDNINKNIIVNNVPYNYQIALNLVDTNQSINKMKDLMVTKKIGKKNYIIYIIYEFLPTRTPYIPHFDTCDVGRIDILKKNRIINEDFNTNYYYYASEYYCIIDNNNAFEVFHLDTGNKIISQKIKKNSKSLSLLNINCKFEYKKKMINPITTSDFRWKSNLILIEDGDNTLKKLTKLTCIRDEYYDLVNYIRYNKNYNMILFKHDVPLNGELYIIE